MSRSWLVLFFTTLAIAEPANQFQFQLRYHGSHIQEHALDETVLYRQQLNNWVGLEAGLRFTQSTADLFRGVDYKAEVQITPLEFVILGARLAQKNYFPESTSSTEVLFTGGFHGYFLPFLGGFATIGWYQRYPLLNDSLIVPSFKSSYQEKDFALQLGLMVKPTYETTVTGRLATYDELTQFNLNNPYLQLDVDYSLAGDAITAFTYFRYQLLLGFGRLDEWMFGLGLRIKLFKDVMEPDDVGSSPLSRLP